jgi:hypothetical protein
MTNPMRDVETGRFLRLPVDPSLPLEKQLELETASVAKRCYWRNRTKLLEKKKQEYPQRRNEILARRRELEYGVDEEFIKRLTSIQNCKCGICKHPLKLYVDHEHKNKPVRGLLCNHCNLKLALIENKAWLRRVFKYLGMEPIDLW